MARRNVIAAAGEPALWPDFLCLSKGISGGFLPLSLVLSRDAIYDAFLDDDVARGFLHSHSYSGNALACAAALAVLERFDHEDVLGANRARAAALEAALAPLRAHAAVEHYRHCGMIWAFDVAADRAGAGFAERLHLAGRAQGLLIRPIGRSVYLMPPYCITDAQSQWLAERLLATLAATLREGVSGAAAGAPEPATA